MAENRHLRVHDDGGVAPLVGLERDAEAERLPTRVEERDTARKLVPLRMEDQRGLHHLKEDPRGHHQPERTARPQRRLAELC